MRTVSLRTVFFFSCFCLFCFLFDFWRFFFFFFFSVLILLLCVFWLHFRSVCLSDYTQFNAHACSSYPLIYRMRTEQTEYLIRMVSVLTRMRLFINKTFLDQNTDYQSEREQQRHTHTRTHRATSQSGEILIWFKKIYFSA